MLEIKVVFIYGVVCYFCSFLSVYDLAISDRYAKFIVLFIITNCHIIKSTYLYTIDDFIAFCIYIFRISHYITCQIMYICRYLHNTDSKLFTYVTTSLDAKYDVISLFSYRLDTYHSTTVYISYFLDLSSFIVYFIHK